MSLSQPLGLKLVRQGRDYVGQLTIPRTNVSGMVLLFRNSQQTRRVDLNRGLLYTIPVCDDKGCPHAAQHSYGGARGLQQLVDACHARGLAVVLDVVYNHMGPEGNYFSSHGPVLHQPPPHAPGRRDQFRRPRRAKIVGNPTTNLPSRRFVVFSQNHDQIGNRMLGEQPGQLVSEAIQQLMAGTVLTSLYLPMLFMGEGWSEQHPFLYFVSAPDPT